MNQVYMHIEGYKPRKIQKRFLGLRESTWFILMLAAFLMVGVIGSTLDMLGAFDVPEAEASFVDYKAIHEEYEGQTKEVCARILSV